VTGELSDHKSRAARAAPVWTERFAEPPAPRLLDYTRSVEVDKRLWPYDIECSKAHAQALAHFGLLSPEDLEALVGGLDAVARELADGSFVLDESDEDIHMAIERRLVELIGEPGLKLHAGRSRNDQVVTDFRLWVKDASRECAAHLLDLAEVLGKKAAEAVDIVSFEYTHLQRSQPVSLGHHLAAHAWPLIRDAKRFRSAWETADVSPLGAAAGVGTALIADPSVAAKALRFSRTFENSVDAVADRDFVLDFLHACVCAQLHMSRLSEEIVLWASSEFAKIELSDRWATGSSIMPQKKNPDAAELARARAALVLAGYVALATVVKGLPLAYNRDLQEDKQTAFTACDTVKASADVLREIVQDSRLVGQGTGTGGPGQLQGSLALATDLVEMLVERGTPFREAHRSVGALVRRLASEGKEFRAVSQADLAECGIEAVDVSEVRELDARRSIESKRGSGMTSPPAVRAQLEQLQQAISREREWTRS
jgi:argininosuccinate lyase